jgi:hypothetical protein
MVRWTYETRKEVRGHSSSRLKLATHTHYFCSWGPDCERFHDIVDEVLMEDDVGEQKFAGPNSIDVIMTTWHAKDSLEDAIDILRNLRRAN